MSKYYITTAIDYANGDPHLGHAFEKIGADVLARYHRLSGDKVHFLMGMDEHGQKVAQAAAANNKDPQAQVDEIAGKFEQTWRYLNISYDQFIRTTDRSHKKGVKALIDRIFERSPDDFYIKSYAGWYCVGCESFKTDAEIEDGKCVLHTTRKLEWVEEKNWFFRLSKYADRLKDLIANDNYLQPKSRKHEILSVIEQGLEDVSASRARLGWGIPFPKDTGNGEDQTTYVWFDALPNYITAIGFPNADSEFETWWPADVHIIGKDITRFHALIWPAMLMAAELPLPKQVFAHGFVMLGGDRFSKSSGVKIDLDETIHLYGPDAFRYFLMREVPFDGDGSFSFERFEERYNSDLANAWGNLASRTMAMIEKYCSGFTPAGEPNEVDAADAEDYQAYHEHMSNNLLNRALDSVWATISRANEYVDKSAPWKLAKDPEKKGELDLVLASLMRQIVRQGIALTPFMPGKTADLFRQLGAPPRHRLTFATPADPTGWRVMKSEPLFPKNDPKQKGSES